MQAGNTALIRAVLNGHVEVVILLLSRGVDKEHHNKVKFLALLWQCQRGGVDFVRINRIEIIQYDMYFFKNKLCLEGLQVALLPNADGDRVYCCGSD